ncbi:caspase-3-like isoform X2 [Physella acuta]|nr:caspase-3-like isoform X2 [Physella acuta]XP_059175775.1 caspase-3-like isoform X2 [Physella acuta]
MDQIDAGGNINSRVEQDKLKLQDKAGHSLPNLTEKEFRSDVYKMNYPKRGVAVIINNRSFNSRTNMGERAGTDVDAESMHRLLNILGFEIIQRNNLTAEEMRLILQTVAAQDHTDNSCFVCIILTHGDEGYVFGTDREVLFDDLVAPFKGNKCKSLASKPKIFLVQACKEPEFQEEADTGMEVESEGETIVQKIPTEADFLVVYSIVPGSLSWRNKGNGSWFIQAIAEIFEKNYQTLDVMTMMTRVIKKVAKDFEQNAKTLFLERKRQIPCITSMLTKDVYFKS